MSSKDPEAGRAFAKDFPNSPRRDQVTRLVAMWSQTSAVQAALDAIARGDVAAAEENLKKITDADRRDEVTTALDALRDREEWEGAKNASALRAYLESRPKGRWASEAKKKLQKLQPKDWDAAWETGSVAAWDRYLADHADSPRAGEAQQHRREAVDFDLATSTNTKMMWRAFLKTWPDGRHRLDAEIRMRTAK